MINSETVKKQEVSIKIEPIADMKPCNVHINIT